MMNGGSAPGAMEMPITEMRLSTAAFSAISLM